MPGTETLNETIAGYLRIQIGQASLGPVDTAVLVLTLTAALLSAFRLWRIGRREDRYDRLTALRGAAATRTIRVDCPSWYARLGAIVAASPIVGIAEQQRLLGVLAAGGIKAQSGLAMLVASKVSSAFLAAALLGLFIEWRDSFAGLTIIEIGLLLVALMLSWRVPDFLLSRFAARRRLQLERGLPDALDLLVICAEAGLSLDQAIEQVSEDLRTSNPAVSEEFATVASEMRVLADRGEALENFVRRTGVTSVRSITATLNQAIRFGTPLAESMRILAAEMRSMRLLRIEERAARLPVLLAIPLALFILPSLLMVICTPVALRLADTLSGVAFGHP
jgi:tight adherence protein C